MVRNTTSDRIQKTLYDKNIVWTNQITEVKELNILVAFTCLLCVYFSPYGVTLWIIYQDIQIQSICMELRTF